MLMVAAQSEKGKFEYFGPLFVFEQRVCSTRDGKESWRNPLGTAHPWS